MKVLYGVIRDYDPVTLQGKASFTWVSFVYPLFGDVVFMVDLFPDTSFTCSLVREDMV